MDSQIPKERKLSLALSTKSVPTMPAGVCSNTQRHGHCPKEPPVGFNPDTTFSRLPPLASIRARRASSGSCGFGSKASMTHIPCEELLACLGRLPTLQLQWERLKEDACHSTFRQRIAIMVMKTTKMLTTI